MSIDLLPPSIRKNYEVHEWTHACAILQKDFPAEWGDLVSLLEGFRFRKSWITVGGGGKSKVSQAIDHYLLERGWVEKEFSTSVQVDDHVMDSPTHKVDCYKN